MGFSKSVLLKRLSKTNIFALAVFVSVFCGVIATNNSAYAAPSVDNYGLYTAPDGVRWEWEVVSDSENIEEPQKLNLMYYDKPENLTTVTIPSYSDMTNITGVTPTSDTYYVRNANQESQDTRFTNPDPARRTANQADVTVLDMTNTSKVQILGVKPIINPATETELIFGENMVIGKNLDVNVTFFVDKCVETGLYGAWTDRYTCTRTERIRYDHAEKIIPGWDEMTEEQKNWYYASNYDIVSMLGYTMYINGSTNNIDVSTGNYATDAQFTTRNNGGVFANYKLKLTNFNTFNYLGWQTFYNSVFSEDSTTITVNGDGLVGEGIFENTNVKKAIINTNTVGSAIFRNCYNLTEVEFSDDVTVVAPLAFKGTNLGSIDFSQTNIKTIKRGAFEYAKLTSVNLDGVEMIDYEAFANNDLTEVFLPRSLKNMNSARLFAGNRNLTKLTVAYDTLNTGTFTPLHAVIGEWVGDSFNVANNIKDLTILAPYGPNDSLDAGHVLYEDYPQRATYCAETGALDEGIVCVQDEYAEANKYKNVIAPGYFAYFGGVENLTIGEGYEYIGLQAFYNYLYGPYVYNTNYYFDYTDWVEKTFHVSLPETLKGIGGGAFASHYDTDFEINLPESLEFIGNRAFYNDYYMSNNVNLPNLRYIGSHAFFTTGIRDLYLHDKLEWVGSRPFQGCWHLRDVTFDYDVFGPNSHLFSAYSRYNGNFSTNIFGHPTTGYNICIINDKFDSENCGKYYSEDEWTVTGWGHGAHKLGAITFTEKASTLPYVIRDEVGYSGYSSSWFYDFAAEKIDLSKTGWTEISAGAFQFSAIDEVVLPESLEIIWGAAFYGTRINKELVLPDTIKHIAGNAFNNHPFYNKGDGVHFDGKNYYRGEELLDSAVFETRKYLTPEDHYPCKMREEYGSIYYSGKGCFRDDWDGTYYYREPFAYTRGVKVTKLPASLEIIGMGAFYLDEWLEADLDNANLTQIGEAAFIKTRLHNVLIPNSITSIGQFAFVGIETLEDITIDGDIFGAIGVPATWEGASSSDWPGYGENGLAAIFNQQAGSPTVELNVNKLTLTGNVPYLTWNREFTTRLQADCPYGEWNENYCRDADGNFDSSSYRYTNFTWMSSLLYGLTADEVDFSGLGIDLIPQNAFNGVKARILKLPPNLKGIPDHAFYAAEVEEKVDMPSGITFIGSEAFQYANIGFNNAFAEGLTAISGSAFYGAEIYGDMTIPSSVTYIGASAFNAGDADTHYDTVTIKAPLDYLKTKSQAVFQMFWNAKMDKLVIDTPMLPVLGTLQDTPILPTGTEIDNGDGTSYTVYPLRTDGEPEFHAMTMKELVIKQLPQITANAFEDCANLEKVDLSEHDSLQRISHHAFNNANKLKTFVFGDGLVGKDVVLEQYILRGTAIESMGDENTDFALTAANFNAEDAAVFSAMPKLTTLYVPSTFTILPAFADAEKNINGSTIPAYTFANDPELKEVTVDYQLSNIDESAFLYDDKLEKLFIWGNTNINENDVELTIPEQTNIFAYSDAPAEQYANDDSRSSYAGKFYPLDEVLFLTSNKTYVTLEQDEEGNDVDFKKDGLKLYALRRDGVVLESDDWQQYTKAFPRALDPSIRFEQGRGGNLGTDENLIWNVYDAQKPFNTISLANENYGNVSFEFMQMPSSNNPLVLIHYPDGYTGNIRTTSLASIREGEEPTLTPDDDNLDVPNTGVFHTISGVAVASFSVSAFVILGAILIVKKVKE